MQPDEQELTLLALIDAEYTRHPFYGSRKIVHYLQSLGHTINRKRVQRLMSILCLAGMAPGPNTSPGHSRHKVYPYLLRGISIDRPNQVWSTDITYIRLPREYVYLVAIIDWYSRKVLSWRLSNTLDSRFCVDCLEQALKTHGVPDVFNTDQGSQFTSDDSSVHSKHVALPSAWMGVAGHRTISLWKGSGAVSSRRRLPERVCNND